MGVARGGFGTLNSQTEFFSESIASGAPVAMQFAIIGDFCSVYADRYSMKIENETHAGAQLI